MRELIKIYKSLSDETRLRALNLLLERECCVCEIEQVLGITQSKASRILATLYDAGFLSLRKEGLWSLYSINREGMGSNLTEILEAAGKSFMENIQMKADRELLKTTVRIGPGCADGICSNSLNNGTVRA